MKEQRPLATKKKGAGCKRANWTAPKRRQAGA